MKEAFYRTLTERLFSICAVSPNDVIVTFVTNAVKDFKHEMRGKFRLHKLAHLAGIVPRILWARLRTGSTVLYYPPAGPDLVPALRDLVILLSTRWAFRHTVFHFHAGGLCELYPRLNRPLKWLFRQAYGQPDLEGRAGRGDFGRVADRRRRQGQ